MSSNAVACLALVLSFLLGWLCRAALTRYHAYKSRRDFYRRMESLLGPDWNSEPEAPSDPFQISDEMADRLLRNDD